MGCWKYWRIKQEAKVKVLFSVSLGHSVKLRAILSLRSRIEFGTAGHDLIHCESISIAKGLPMLSHI